MDQLNRVQGSLQAEAPGLRAILARAGRRLRLRDGWLLAQRALWLGCLGGVLVQLAGRLWPVERLWLWTALPLAGCLLAAAAYSLLRPLPLLLVARRTDAELGLKERLATALLLEEWKVARSEGREVSAFQPALVALQEQDALAAALSVDLRRDLPLPWLKRRLLTAAGLAALALALAVLPNPMDSILEERRAVAQAAEEQAEAIEELRQEVEAAEELQPEEREELLRRLEELARELRDNPGDREEALADLSKVEEALRQELDPNIDARQAALEALVDQLQALAGEDADLSEAAEALERLAEGAAGREAAEQGALARSLAQMAARAAASGDQALAQALAAMAQAVQAGDSQAASEAAHAAGQALAQAQDEMAAQETLKRALDSVQASRRAVAEAGGGQAVAGEPGEGQGQGQGQGQVQGQGPGQGQGQGQGQGGQPGGGGGTQADTLPPAQGTGEAGRPEGEGQAGRVGEPASQVYVPWERRPGSGEELVIPGQDSGQGETETRETEDPLPGTAGEALVPYHEVYYTYLDAAQQAMESGTVPLGLRELVRAYFSQLEP